MRDLLAAAGKHHPHGVDEGDAGAVDHLRRHGLEVEAGDELGEQLRELLGAGLRRTRLLRPRGIGQVGQSAERQRARAEEMPPVEAHRLIVFAMACSSR